MVDELTMRLVRLVCILVQMGEDYEVPGKDDSSNSSSSVYLEV